MRAVGAPVDTHRAPPSEGGEHYMRKKPIGAALMVIGAPGKQNRLCNASRRLHVLKNSADNLHSALTV